MKLISIKHLVIGLCMLVAASLALALTPRTKVASQGPGIRLESMIQKRFGAWKVDETIAPLMVSPEVKAQLDKIYNETLTRTYINANGAQVMLSIAYGSDQSSSLQVHRPDVCYTAQGFQVSKMVKDFVQTVTGQVPVMHLVASQGRRNEPITYWITVGDTAVRGVWEQKLAKVKYGLTGKVPDGILVRVSNISSDAPDSYQLHQEFVNDMLKGMREEDRLRLVGRL